MNLDHPIHWRIQLPPSASSIYPIGEAQTDMQEVILAFVITLSLCSKDSVTREFPGGTLQSLLQMIYEFYQEPVSAAELDRITAGTTQCTSGIRRNHSAVPSGWIWCIL
jgi:hypothetical protein